jgi:hypothetical protein
LKKGYRVIGIEADPQLAAHCRKRFASDIASGALRLIEGAIAAIDQVKRRSVTFYKNANSVWGTIDPKWRERNDRFGSPSTEIE